MLFTVTAELLAREQLLRTRLFLAVHCRQVQRREPLLVPRAQLRPPARSVQQQLEHLPKMATGQRAVAPLRAAGVVVIARVWLY